nr:IS66 family insertion sequence element accessory protein TnpB [Bradyrhizobium algeriense]
MWRRQVAAAVAGKPPNFVPIQIGAESGGGTAGESERISPVQTKPLEISAPRAKACGVIEIEVSGARIRGEPGVELATLVDRAGSASGHPVIALRSDLKVVLATQPVDFRKSVHTLSALVSEALRANPYCGDVFVFRSKRMDRVKLLAWELQRHGAGDEVAAPGTLYLAARPRRRGASKCDAARDAARLSMRMPLLVRLSDSEIKMIERVIA